MKTLDVFPLFMEGIHPIWTLKMRPPFKGQVTLRCLRHT